MVLNKEDEDTHFYDEVVGRTRIVIDVEDGIQGVRVGILTTPEDISPATIVGHLEQAKLEVLKAESTDI